MNFRLFMHLPRRLLVYCFRKNQLLTNGKFKFYQ
ncbi:hypothetical protein ALO81_200176 [Pseudomonas cannabina]|uniref:Transcriptional regulator n=1 Tax=Pseudomonas cannabina TaxID=86840 RepID=A0A0N8R014_PSECA|nr:hypothetical protein ALO81_200176 [Pseudomonas cannabina]